MKFTVASLALASYAMGELSLFAPASSSVGVQCQGDCQGDESVAPQADGSAVPGAIHAFMREFMGTNEPASSTAFGRAAGQPTPVIELIYNYINVDSASEEDAAVVQPTAAAEQGPINRLVAAFMGPGSDMPASSVGVEEDYPASAESSQPNAFDFNSWGDRVSSAANRLVKNVEGIVVQFMPTASASPADNGAFLADNEVSLADDEASLADVDQVTAATNFMSAESSNPVNWYDFI
ncbi:hypothetical protein EV183_004064 [Coemansia sp. RSA 2336]|nr:hypothetical protein EV183_004064 [Coemansia sp. RSA 2336]